MSGYTARNPLTPPEAPSWLPPEDAAVLERLRSPTALNPLLGPDPYGGAAIGTSSTRPQAQAVDANGQPFDPVVGRGLPVTRGQLAGISESAWQTAGAVSDGGLAAPGMIGAIRAYHGSPGAPSPGISLVDETSRWGREQKPSGRNYAIEDANGRHLGTINTNWDPMMGELTVENIQGVGGPNSLGPTLVKQIRAALLEHYPETRVISGERVTGAGPGGGDGAGREAFQRVKP